MAKKGAFNFTEEWFIEKGFEKQKDGSFKKPGTFKNPLTTTAPIGKEKVVDTIDFTAKPSTEWFISNYNVPSKKNSRQNFVKNGKQVSIPSKQHADYVKMTQMQFEVFGREFKKAVTHYGLVYPLSVEFTFIRSSHRRFDYCNACQTIEDLMVKYDWITDDSADHLIPVFKPYEYNKEVPGVKIKLIIK